MKIKQIVFFCTSKLDTKKYVLNQNVCTNNGNVSLLLIYSLDFLNQEKLSFYEANI